PFGGGPWGHLGGQLTLSPVKADLFVGYGEVPSNFDLATKRLYLEVDELAPELAARVSINGQYAGGFIGKPLRLEVTKHLKSGRNAIRIEPSSPKSARLVTYE
ncbi:MAG: hypothetical protein NTW03_04260, partial [Verrucomicrobia bacterium]|nr:hypothetical protein [Verrucomicrobiota bacterium]